MDMDMDIETLRSCRALHRLLVLINHPIDRLGALDMLLFLTKLPHFSPKSVRLLPFRCLPFNSPQALPAIARVSPTGPMLCSVYLWLSVICTPPISLCHQSVRLAKVSASRAPPARLELGWDEVEYDNRYSDDDEVDAVQGTWTEDAELILGADMLLGAASSSSDDDMDELQMLVGEWQEQQALADESGGPTTASQQVAMTQRPNPSPS
jgi:hypothetical protein